MILRPLTFAAYNSIMSEKSLLVWCDQPAYRRACGRFILRFLYNNIFDFEDYLGTMTQDAYNIIFILRDRLCRDWIPICWVGPYWKWILGKTFIWGNWWDDYDCGGIHLMSPSPANHIRFFNQYYNEYDCCNQCRIRYIWRYIICLDEYLESDESQTLRFALCSSNWPHFYPLHW